KKPHMGDLTEITDLLCNINMSDEAVLSVIDPPVQEKDREELVAQSRIEDLQSEFNIRNNSQLSTMTTWRLTGRLGAFLDSQRHVVRANFFPINTDALPKTIFNYRVGIFRIATDKEQQLRQEDDLCSKKGESGLTTQLLRALIKSHKEWHTNSKGENVGFAYSGTSTLYTTMRLYNLNIKIGENEEIAQLKSNGFEQEIKFTDKNYLVILNETTGTRNMPKTLGKYSVSYCMKFVFMYCDCVMPLVYVVDWVDPKNFEMLHALDVSLLSFARWEEGKDRPKWVLAGSKVYK
ncbi:hypothetical protein EON64_07435, partial [archaeon]